MNTPRKRRHYSRRCKETKLKPKHRIWVVILAVTYFAPSMAFSAIEENYEVSFEVKNATTKKTFIVLRLPNDVPKVGLEYKNIARPVLFIDYIAEDASAMRAIQNRMAVTYQDNQTIVSQLHDSDGYKCTYNEYNGFKGGACFRVAKLILPPDLEVSIFQNETLIYSRADLLEIKKQQFPNLAKGDPATAKAKKQSTEAKLKELNSMLRKGLITKEEYSEKKKALLDGM